MRAGVARYTSMSTAWYLPRQLSSERGRIQRPGGSTGLRSHPIDRLAGPVRSVDGRELSAKCMEPSNYSCHTITTSHQVLRSPCPDAAACMSYRWEDSIGCGKHDMAPGRRCIRSGGGLPHHLAGHVLLRPPVCWLRRINDFSVHSCLSESQIDRSIREHPF